MDKIAILIPAYNEAATIGEVIKSIRKVTENALILVVDDGSTDATGRIATEAGALVITHRHNLNCVQALKSGYNFLLNMNFNYIVQIDADGQHDATYIPILLGVLSSNKADLVIGSRFLLPTGYSDTPLRMLGHKLCAKLASFLLGQKITDSSSGFRALNIKAANFAADHLPKRYPDANFLYAAKRAGLRIVEVAVSMRVRTNISQYQGWSAPFRYAAGVLWDIVKEKCRCRKLL